MREQTFVVNIFANIFHCLKSRMHIVCR